MSEDAPRVVKKRKKKRVKKADPVEATEHESTEPPRSDVPAFALAYPLDDEDLEEIARLFEQGHYGDVRERAMKLVHQTERDEVRRAARDVLKRLEPDPVAKYLIAGAAVLLVFLAGWFWTHPHTVP